MARYQPNRESFGRMMKSRPIRRITNRAARAGANYVRSIAPVDTGAYRDSIRVEDGLSQRGDRVASYVVADDPAAAPLEWGNERVPNPPRPLQQMIGFIEGGGS